MKNLFTPVLLLLAACHPQLTSNADTVLWSINSLDSIAGLPTQVEGNPVVTDTGTVSFDGDGDRLLVNHNPLAGAREFTVEIIFKPYDVFPRNWEPRFFHIESSHNPDRRLTLELRLNDQKQWYLDAFIKSEKSSLTLIDSTKVHPVNQWFHAAVTYKNGVLVSFVNGQKELEGKVDYLPINVNAKTSIGARMNRIHWFNGEIKTIRISHQVLSPDDFLSVQ